MSNRPFSSSALPRSTIAALTRAGYETFNDISGIPPESLAQELNISLQASQAIFSAVRKPQMTGTSMPLTQSAALMISASERFPTCCPPLDKLLSGGLSRGHIVEISGPPGTPKETLAVNLVKSFIEVDEAVLFVDSQNMTSPATLDRALRECSSVPPHYRRLIHHINIHTLPDFMIFMHGLPLYLDDHPKTRLLVLNSISFPFQSSPTLTPSTRAALLDRVKQPLATLCTSMRLSVVTTSQLSTKLLNPDGSAGNFDTGSKAVIVPQLGPSYLPSGRAHRVIIVPESPTTGVIRVISSPTYQPGNGTPPQESYSLDELGIMK